MSDDADNILIITETAKRSFLWDPEHKDYTDPDKRKAGWVGVCCQLVNNYKDLSYDLQKKLLDDTVAEWKSLLEIYYLIAEGDQSDFTPERKRFMDLMSFLKPIPQINSDPDTWLELEHKRKILYDSVMKSSIIKSNYFREQEQLQLSGSVIKSLPDIEQYSKPKSKAIDPAVTLSLKKLSLSHEQAKPQELDSKTLPPPKERLPSASSNSTLYATKENSQLQLESHASFFFSLLPWVKNLNEIDKLKFRLELLNTLTKFKEQELAQKNQGHSDMVNLEDS